MPQPISSPRRTPKKKTTSKKSKSSSTTTPQQSAILDSFEKQKTEQGDRHVRMEQRAQLWAQEQLHRKRIAEIHQQLQLQLFKMWNEMWLQKQKTWNDAHKAWLKVFMA